MQSLNPKGSKMNISPEFLSFLNPVMLSYINLKTQVHRRKKILSKHCLGRSHCGEISGGPSPHSVLILGSVISTSRSPRCVCSRFSWVDGDQGMEKSRPSCRWRRSILHGSISQFSLCPPLHIGIWLPYCNLRCTLISSLFFNQIQRMLDNLVPAPPTRCHYPSN